MLNLIKFKFLLCKRLTDSPLYYLYLFVRLFLSPLSYQIIHVIVQICTIHNRDPLICPQNIYACAHCGQTSSWMFLKGPNFHKRFFGYGSIK